MQLKIFPERGFSSNSYLLISLEEGLLIDPGDNGQEILKVLKDRHLELKYIINTHGHVDHILGNGILKEKTNATLLIHREDGPMLTDGKKNLASFFPGLSLEGPPADSLLEDSDRISLNSLELEVLHTPGHTPGGISLLGAGILFSGDTLFAQGIGRTDFPGGSMEILMRSIRERLMTLDEKTKVYAGHGPQSTIGGIKRENYFI